MNSTNLNEFNGIDSLLNKEIYQAYSYSYPHKTAYRPFDTPIKIEDIWQAENQASLFLYVHIPFCEMRCGFCNLFTLVRPSSNMPDLYLDALERQINAIKPAISTAEFSRYAIGGGTPTYLTTAQLERLFNITDIGLKSKTPIAIEVSPETITADKVSLLESRRISRISMGVQSYTESETQILARRQDNSQIHKAIDIIRQHSKADLNLDLIYGIAGQTPASWLYSLKQAVAASPEELYLYPLYVRDKTGLGKIQAHNHIATDLPEMDYLHLYRIGRDFLLAEGYQQISMRMFRKASLMDQDIPVYSCQEDGMLGLGAGARSYSQALHYSSEYAVGRHKIKDIIGHYIEQPEAYFTHAHYGIALSIEEQKRRFVIQSLLTTDGLDCNAYKKRFGTDCKYEFGQLNLLIQNALAQESNQCIRLSASGLERADSIGPWLASNTITERMQEYQLA